MIEREPQETIPSHERFQLAAIGIEKGKPFVQDAARKALFDDAARFASAVARTNSFDSDDPARLVYPDRAWEWAFIGLCQLGLAGLRQHHRRSAFAYIAIGMIQTTPGKGWFTLFRFYGPLEAFFDQSWKPDDIVEVKS